MNRAVYLILRKIIDKLDAIQTRLDRQESPEDSQVGFNYDINEIRELLDAVERVET